MHFAVYTLVRFTGVTNYLAVTGSPDDHEACLDLNLPCWDASRYGHHCRVPASLFVHCSIHLIQLKKRFWECPQVQRQQG